MYGPFDIENEQSGIQLAMKISYIINFGDL